MSRLRHPHNRAPGTQSWLTQPTLIAILGPFDLDPAAAPRPWPTAAAHFTKADDGLARDWFGRVWLNPPYRRGLIERFMAKMAGHGCGTALVFARTCSAWFQDHVFGAADAVLFLRGREVFCDVRGTPAAANGGASNVLAAYGAQDAERLGDSGLPGQFVALTLPRFVSAALARPTWRDAVAEALARHDGPVRLETLYAALAGHRNARSNRHVREKIRQTLQRGRGVRFARAGRGEWMAIEGRTAA